MAGKIGKNSLRGIAHEDFHYSFLVSGGVAVDINDVGKAVTIDTAAANTVKLATDGASILGYLASYEDRKQEGTVNGAVALFGGHRFAVDPNATASSPDETPAVGDFIVGAVSNAGKAGFVRKASTLEMSDGAIRKWLVVEVEGSGATLKVVAIAL